MTANSSEMHNEEMSPCKDGPTSFGAAGIQKGG